MGLQVNTPSGLGEIYSDEHGIFSEKSDSDTNFKFSQLPLKNRNDHLQEKEMVGDGSLYMYKGGLFFATYDKNGSFVNKISIDK